MHVFNMGEGDRQTERQTTEKEGEKLQISYLHGKTRARFQSILKIHNGPSAIFQRESSLVILSHLQIY